MSKESALPLDVSPDGIRANRMFGWNGRKSQIVATGKYEVDINVKVILTHYPCALFVLECRSTIAYLRDNTTAFCDALSEPSRKRSLSVR